MSTEIFDQLKAMPRSAMVELTEESPSLDHLGEHTRAGDTHEIPADPLRVTETGNGQYSGNDAPPAEMKASDLLPSSMIVELIDMVIPVLMVILMDKVFAKKTHKSFFQATEQEKELIQPALENYLRSIKVNIDNPLSALIIVCLTVYGSKTIELMTGQMQPQAEGIKTVARRQSHRKKTADMAEYMREWRKKNKKKKVA